MKVEDDIVKYIDYIQKYCIHLQKSQLCHKHKILEYSHRYITVQ